VSGGIRRQEIIETVEQAYLDFQAFLRGDLPGEALAQLLDPEIEWDWNLGLLRPRDTPERVRDASELIAFVEQVRATWPDFRVEALEFTEAPQGRVLVHARLVRRVPDQATLDAITVHHLWTIRVRCCLRVKPAAAQSPTDALRPGGAA
jgi:hypothetical protein